MRLAGLMACAVVLLLVEPWPAFAAYTERVSVASDGTEGDERTNVSDITSDGRYVALWSLASNLVPGDTNGVSDIFVHDRETGTTERVSVASDGTQGDGYSVWPTISDDGRYVAFISAASSLVPADTNEETDVFVHDRQTGETERVSVASDGTQGDGGIMHASISADGTCVAFASHATNLVANDENGRLDIFVHVRATGSTERVSVASSGAEGDLYSEKPSISSDGRYVAFLSAAANLVGNDTNDAPDAFVRDRQTNTTTRVSVASDGTQGNGTVDYPAISADGRYVTFSSHASNLVSGDTNGEADVFLRDRVAGTTERVSVAGDGSQANESSWTSSITSDGRYVAFDSQASNLVPGDANGLLLDVFLRDRQTATTELLSVSTDGVQGSNSSDYPIVTNGAQYVLFVSHAPDLVVDDTNGYRDAFVRVRFEEGVAADFTASPLEGVIPLAVSFTDVSTGTPTSWQWSFGDGTVSIEQNPSHQYDEAGKYTVALTAANGYGQDTETRTDYIRVGFPDTPPGFWSFDYILDCVGAGVAGGYPDGLYHPEGTVSRDQMAVFIARGIAGGDDAVPTGPAEATFDDVPTDYWAYDHIEYCVAEDIVGGYDPVTYAPEVAVTRDQMAVFISRTVADGDANVPDGPTTATFDDVPTDFWAYRYVEYCVANDIVGGYDPVTYGPDTVVTRDQMAVFISRAFDLAT